LRQGGFDCHLTARPSTRSEHVRSDRSIAAPKLDNAVFTQNGLRVGDSSDQCSREKQVGKKFAR
jgi:hypothetical protein